MSLLVGLSSVIPIDILVQSVSTGVRGRLISSAIRLGPHVLAHGHVCCQPSLHRLHIMGRILIVLRLHSVLDNTVLSIFAARKVVHGELTWSCPCDLSFNACTNSKETSVDDQTCPERQS